MSDQRRKKRKIKRRVTLKLYLLLTLVILGTGIFYFIANGNVFNRDGDTNSLKKELQAMNISSQKPSFSAADLQLNSSEYLLMKLETKEVIAENDGDKKIYPASMTKIMTAILSLENLPDLDRTIQIPEEIFQEIYNQNASRAGFEPGETATVRDLLYGVILPSGAECCLTFANEIAGSEAAFVELMNQKAAELGMDNTHFCNSTGLHDEQHYSSAKDMAVLLQYALQDGNFRAVFTKSRHTTSGSSIHPEGFTVTSTLFKYIDDVSVPGGELLGGKTGYTSEAGQCLASLANIGGEDYILVTAGADVDNQEAQLHIQDAFTVYNKLGEAIGSSS